MWYKTTKYIIYFGMGIFSFKKVKILCLIILLFLFSALVVLSPISSAWQKNKSKNFVVVLDAGHGGIDGGAEGINSKVKESELNLKICFLLKELFENSNFKVVMTRSEDVGLYGDTSEGFKKRDLIKRVQIANASSANVFISVHLNTYKGKSRRGAQVFFKRGDLNSQSLADNIQTELNLLKESKRMYDAITGDYYLLNNVKCTSVIVECGFLSNPEEEKLLLSEDYRKQLANSIYKGSLRYLLNLQ